MGWLNKLFNLDNYRSNHDHKPAFGYHTDPKQKASGASASKRLKLVLMHDRTQLSPEMMEKMRDELVEVISRYVEIDKDALDINFETESNTIALVANIPVVRARPAESHATEPDKDETGDTSGEAPSGDSQDKEQDTEGGDQDKEHQNPFSDPLSETLKETVEAADKPPYPPAKAN